MKWEPKNVTFCAIFRAVFDSRSSFFAPKPHGNAATQANEAMISRFLAIIERG